jgi:hypothetical protein
MVDKILEEVSANLCLWNVFRRSDPFYFVARLLNGIYQAPDVAGDIVQQVNSGHCTLDMMDGKYMKKIEGIKTRYVAWKR